jgi:IS30 family transposase
MEAALTAIESLEPGEKFTYQEIADQYGIQRSTLSRRHRGRQGMLEAQRTNQQKLNPQQELELVSYIEDLTERELPPTREMIQNFASTIATEPVSNAWVTRFLHRQDDHLISKWSSGIDSVRHNADSNVKYTLYFDLLHAKMKQYNVQPCHCYNMDEKGFMIGVTGRSKRVFT